jgi:hypothetical protein
LHAAGEVRAPQFGSAESDLDAEMVAIAGAIVRQRTGNFDPSTCHDRYQEALRSTTPASFFTLSKRKGLPHLSGLRPRDRRFRAQREDTKLVGLFDAQ